MCDILLGLGNYAKQYYRTRHNAGFLFNDELLQRNGEQYKSNKIFDSCELNVEQNLCVVAKGRGYMNNSGLVARKLLDVYKVPISNLFVVHDDIQTKLGKIKISIGGGSYGHNGIRSIAQHCGADFVRIRIGVGRSDDVPVHDYVLSDFTKEELSLLHSCFDVIIGNLRSILNRDFSCVS